MTTPAGSSTSVRTGAGGMRTEYVYVTDAKGNQTLQKNRSYQPATSVPRGIPRFLGNRQIMFGAWAVGMALISWDEWKANNILPRPLRLWETTMVYAILALASTADFMVPICNALAIGYTLVLLYEFFTGGGNFGGPGV
jgi:hypothetical protein